MNMYRLALIACPILIAMGLYEMRNTLCESKGIKYYYNVVTPVVIGMILILTSVIIAYKTNFLGTKDESTIISDIILLNGPSYPHNYRLILMIASIGYVAIITSIEIVIICKLLKKGIISPKKGNNV